MAEATIWMDAPPNIINQKTNPQDREYYAGLNGKKIRLYANSLYGAKTEAIAYFKPRKNQMGLLWVIVAEEQTNG